MHNPSLLANDSSTKNTLEQAIQETRQTPEEHLPSLLQIIRLFRESVTLNSAEESFHQGWKEAMTGETIPVSQLWDKEPPETCIV